MGCSKNLVDSEHLLRQFQDRGFQIYHNPDCTHGDIAVVNTCGFIGDAKEESINMILTLCEEKERGLLSEIYVMGCLSERYLAELREEIPQVDKFYGKFNWNELLSDLSSAYNKDIEEERVLTTPLTLLISKFQKDVTVRVPIVPFLSLQVATRAVQWKTFLTKCAVW